MPYLLSILVKCTLISGLFYFWYAVILRNKRMHQYNRFYLLAATGLSLLLPFVQFTIHYGERVQSPAIAQALRVINMGGEETIIAAPANHAIQATDVVAIVYAAVCLVLLARIGWAIYRIVRIKYKGKIEQWNEINLVVTTAPSAPFSFMRTLYWRQGTDMNSDEGQRVMAHEQVHIRQYHSIDKLAMEVIRAVCWANPFFLLIKRELGMVHEFIADEQSVGDDVPALAAMLLSSAGYSAVPLANSFYYSPIKRRLDMLMKNKDTRFTTMRKLFVIPLAAIAIGTFCLTATARTTGAAHKKVTVVLDAGHGGQDAGAIKGDIMEKTMTLRIVKRLAVLAKDYNIDVIQTRKGDDYPTLNQRAMMSNSASVNMFVSIHLNKTNTYNHFDSDYLVYTSPGNARAKESAALATALAGSMAAYKPQLATKNLWVLKQNTHPAVLIECGNIDKPDQLQLVQDSKKLDELCKSILSGIAAYANKN